jgi:hypothetical protein
MTRSARNSAATRTRRTVTESQTACQLHCAVQTPARNSPDPPARCLAACDSIRLIGQPLHFLEARASLSFLGRGYYNCTPLCLLPRQSSRSSTFLFRVYQAVHLPEPRGSLQVCRISYIRISCQQPFCSRPQKLTPLPRTLCRRLPLRNHQQTLLEQTEPLEDEDETETATVHRTPPRARFTVRGKQMESSSHNEEEEVGEGEAGGEVVLL